MRLSVQREYITKITEKEAVLKVFKALFIHENRIRALEGKAPITKAQFIAALKSL